MAENVTQRSSNLFFYLMMALMLFVGAVDTVLLKLLVEARDNEGNKFKHPYFMSVHLFFSTLIGNVFYFIYKRIQVKKYGSLERSPAMQRAIEMGKKPHLHAAWLIIPSILVVIAAPLTNMGIILINASVYQMLRGSLILITAMMSIIFLKSRLHRHHWISLVLIIGGIVIVGISSILRNAKGENKILGISCIILSQCFSASHWILQEKFLRTHFIHPFRLVGIEGFWALLMSIVMVVILQFVP